MRPHNSLCPALSLRPALVSHFMPGLRALCMFSHPLAGCDPSCCPLSAASAPQVLFSDGKFQWKRLENLITLAKEGASSSTSSGRPGLDLSDTVKDALRVFLLDEKLRKQVRAGGAAGGGGGRFCKAVRGIDGHS